MIRKLKHKIAGWFPRRYFVLNHISGYPLNVRVDIFGTVQYLKTDPALQLAANMCGDKKETPLFWMNMVERNNKSDWVKDNVNQK
jgi:hypothetical protein